MADVAIIMTTWAPAGEAGRLRCAAARQALRSWYTHLAGATFHVYICPDGSQYITRRGLGVTHANAITNVCDDIGWPWTLCDTDRLGVGGAMNAGLRQAFADGHEIILYAADDWALLEPLDLSPSIGMLERSAAGHGDPAMVRLGPTHPNLSATTRQIAGSPDWALAYDWRNGGYVYADRPSLRHRALYDLVGWYLEGVSALEVEADFNRRCAAVDAGDRSDRHLVWHAPNVTLTGPWRHIDGPELGEDAPATLTARYAG